MEIDKEEFAARTVWRKYLKHEEPEGVFGHLDAKYAGVFCVREVSGYAVWYRRRLAGKFGTAEAVKEGRADGDYLLRFYAPDGKHEAIEFAVLATRPGEDPAAALAYLDALVKDDLRIETTTGNGPVWETVK